MKSAPRTYKAVALFSIAIVVFAAIVPVASTLVDAILTPLWLVVPSVTVAVFRRRVRRCDEQPASLLSLVLSRAPPT